MPSAFKGNKTLDYYMAYHDPSQAQYTPAKRQYSVWGPIQATTVGRAVSKFWKEVLDEEDWGKDDIVLIGAMPSPNDITKLDNLESDEFEPEEDDEPDESEPEEDEEEPETTGPADEYDEDEDDEEEG